MNIIETRNLTKSFGSFKALKEVNLTVKKGEVHGFIGPNGAGKSTTIRILLGLLRKSSGTVSLLGGDPWKDAVTLHANLVYVPGDVSLWPDLTGGEIIDFLGRLQGKQNLEKRNELIKKFQLDLQKKSSTYSKGNRQKVALIAALSCDVDLYLFDEPTSGLDPLMEATFQECVAEIKSEGKTVLLSSHILSEVEALCDRVSIIRQGTIVETGTLQELRHLTRTTISIATQDIIPDLDQIEGVYDISYNNNQYRFSIDGSAINHVMKKLSSVNIQSFTAEPPSLEDLFMRHYDVKEEI
ncbi:ATP-binding cassette domain-containing protein [Ornithinibacillus sp. 4-3]|uniref:ATP-binding cassette domain-containing protein n=1 Tax=Ornithinibacillus sp. 4-3 TaxID=3231488 RepID=A0AB39HPT0_9BACI